MEDEVEMNLTDLTASEAPATITVEQVAEVLQLSRSTVYESVKRAQIPSLRVGRRIVIPVPRFLEWLGAKKETTVVVPSNPPELTPRAARALLGVLFDAAMRDDDS
jgi:excisionase family DNA binding protein